MRQDALGGPIYLLAGGKGRTEATQEYIAQVLAARFGRQSSFVAGQSCAVARSRGCRPGILRAVDSQLAGGSRAHYDGCPGRVSSRFFQEKLK